MKKIRLLRIGGLLALLVLLWTSAAGQITTPQFKDYPAKGKYAGKNARVVITRDDRNFRTVLREEGREKPDFAGHYIIAAWGCGAGCLMGAAIDANTGKVYWFPHTICCWNETTPDENFSPIEYRLNSRLIVFHGLRNEEERDRGPHYYEFDGKRFKFIRTIPSSSKSK